MMRRNDRDHQKGVEDDYGYLAYDLFLSPLLRFLRNRILKEKCQNAKNKNSKVPQIIQLILFMLNIGSDHFQVDKYKL